ncbi:MAG: hypothetical protein K8J08_08835 [Thermoanaerobaculia bacterium]|nr:hypothetical protein [Thermoanaerobaculia bacterium]
MTRSIDWLLLAVFFTVLWLPVLDSVFGLDPAPPVIELRRLARRPAPPTTVERIEHFPRRFERYYDDHFGFRKTLIRWSNRLRFFLHENPLDAEVVIGKSDWLYFNAGEGLVDDWRAIRPFSPDELAEERQQLVNRKHWLEQRGIHYLFVIAPDKHSIYPEFLPSSLRRAATRDRTDQLIDSLVHTTDIEVLDLRPVLRAAKTEVNVYPSNDSHWNDRGAYIAYTEIQRRIAQWYPTAAPLPEDAFEITLQRRQGDLARMLSLEDSLLASVEWWQPRNMRAQRIDAGSRPPGAADRRMIFEIPDPTLPRALMFRDSFAEKLQPFLNEHYRHIAYYWTNFRPKVVLAERPELVIEERSERLAVAP